MKNSLLIISLLLPFALVAQFDFLHIGTDAKESSAIIQLDADDRGILIPRLHMYDRINMSNPAEGTLVYDIITKSFWFHTGIEWVELYASKIIESQLYDNDLDTGIDLEQSPDEDIIKMEANGVSILRIQNGLMKIEDGTHFDINTDLTNFQEGLKYNPVTNSLHVGEAVTINWDLAFSGVNSFSSGYNSAVNGKNSFSIGSSNFISSQNGTALGTNHFVSGMNATAIGVSGEARGDNSLSRGSGANAEGRTSTAWGNQSSSQGNLSTSWGRSIAKDILSTSFGYSLNEDVSSTTWGNAKTNNANQTAWGHGVEAYAQDQIALGTYTSEFNSVDKIFAIGNGSSLVNKLNVFEVTKENETIFSGDLSMYTNGPSAVIGLKENTNGILFGFEFDYNAVNEHLYLRSRSFAGNDAIRMTFDEQGRMGIGRTPTTNKLEVNGNASKASPGPWAGNSDKRLKKNIQYFNSEDILEKVLLMRGVTYEWNDSMTGMERPTEIQQGFIAQDLKTIWPEYITTDQLGYLQTAYGDYDALFVASFQAHQTIINQIQLGNKTLAEQNKNVLELNKKMAKEIASIESYLSKLQ